MTRTPVVLPLAMLAEHDDALVVCADREIDAAFLTVLRVTATPDRPTSRASVATIAPKLTASHDTVLCYAAEMAAALGIGAIVDATQPP
ncbi:MAG: hypothetical protein AAFX10_08655 [Pseudomonadota bacterium]